MVSRIRPALDVRLPPDWNMPKASWFRKAGPACSTIMPTPGAKGRHRSRALESSVLEPAAAAPTVRTVATWASTAASARRRSFATTLPTQDGRNSLVVPEA